jgi:large subunit ribosomal protein L25
MAEIKLSAEKRERIGKGAARKLRKTGCIPGVLYGPEIEPANVIVKTLELAGLLRAHGNAKRLIDLTLDGENGGRKVIIRELQRDPITGDFRHVDLYQVSMTKRLHLTARVRLVGTPAGVKLGGIMQHIIRDLDIACLPSDIPDRVEVEVSDLEIGDSVHVSDISIDKVEILTNPARTIVTVVPPTVIKTAAEEAAEAAPEEEAVEEVAEGEAKPEEEGETGAEGEAKAKAKKEEPRKESKKESK